MIRVNFFMNQAGTNHIRLEESSDGGDNWTIRPLSKGEIYFWQDGQAGDWDILIDDPSFFGQDYRTAEFRDDNGDPGTPLFYPQAGDPVTFGSGFQAPPNQGGDGGVYKPSLPSVAKVVKPEGVAKVVKPEGVGKVGKPEGVAKVTKG